MKNLDKESNNRDTSIQRRRAILGVVSGVAVVKWKTPIVNTVLLPAHAQMSVPVPTPDPTPAELCPMAVIANVLSGPVSGSASPPVCTISFDVLSSSADASLIISDISSVSSGSTNDVTVSGLGSATTTRGPRVVWNGPATDAPFCTDVMPIDTVTFTVTAGCEASGGDEFSQTFTLAEVIAS